jgi:hypothetical protein
MCELQPSSLAGIGFYTVTPCVSGMVRGSGEHEVAAGSLGLTTSGLELNSPTGLQIIEKCYRRSWRGWPLVNASFTEKSELEKFRMYNVIWTSYSLFNKAHCEQRN